MFPREREKKKKTEKNRNFNINNFDIRFVPAESGTTSKDESHIRFGDGRTQMSHEGFFNFKKLYMIVVKTSLLGLLK